MELALFFYYYILVSVGGETHTWRSENQQQESVFSFYHMGPRVPSLTGPSRQPLFFFFIQRLLETVFALWSIPGDINSK